MEGTWKTCIEECLASGCNLHRTDFAALITGSFVVEKVFGIPGIGNLFTNSILNRDYTLIMGITVFFSVILVICILVVDILYVLIDPRIKYQ